MGLDQYIYKVHKLDQSKLAEMPKMLGISERQLAKLYNVDKDDLMAFSEDDMKDRCSELLPYAIKIDNYIEQGLFDEESLRHDYNIPNTASLGKFSSHPTSDYYSYCLTFFDDEDNRTYEINLTEEEYKSYYYSRTCTMYIVCMYEEGFYWRKSYEIQDLLEERKSGISNCVYYELNKEDLEAISLVDNNFDLSSFDLEDNEAYFYMSWW